MAIESNLTVIDVIKKTKWQQPLIDAIDRIKYDPHHNSGNYKLFKDRLEHYDCLTILVQNGVIHAFSGLYNNGIYPSDTIRALDRTYYFNHDKHDSSFQPEYRYATQIMWPYQVKRARSLGYESVFFSMQNIKKRKAFEKIASRCKPKPIILPDLGNTCRILDGKINQDPLCWQNIAVYKFRKYKYTHFLEKELPTIKIEDYKKKYSKELLTLR